MTYCNHDFILHTVEK